jgi:hypothetical protein
MANKSVLKVKVEFSLPVDTSDLETVTKATTMVNNLKTNLSQHAVGDVAVTSSFATVRVKDAAPAAEGAAAPAEAGSAA